MVISTLFYIETVKKRQLFKNINIPLNCVNNSMVYINMYINANHLIKKNNNNEPLLYETLKYLSKEDFNKINNCEIIQCKHCGNNDSDYYRKSGIVHGKQRYYCKKCKKHFSIKSNQFFLDLIKSYAIYMHINNCGLRSIGRVLGVSFQLVAYWIKTGKDKIEKVKKEMIKKEGDKSIYNKKRNIRVLEMDELFTFIKKNQKMKKVSLILIREYGLLLIGIKEN